jgi:hypothetical protein
MDANFIDRFRHVLNNDVAGRLLIKYFTSKGFDCFDSLIYPPLVSDISGMIPEMMDKIEIVPYARNIDPMRDIAELGWNLFVLGNNRMYLGETFHNGLKQLALQLQQGAVLSEDRTASRQTTPRRIINFITRVLVSNRGGYLNLTPRVVPMQLQKSLAGSGSQMSHQFFSRVGGYA